MTNKIWYTADPVSAKKLFTYIKHLALVLEDLGHPEPPGSDPELIVNYAGMVTLIYRGDDSDMHVDFVEMPCSPFADKDEFNTDRPAEYTWTKMSKDAVPMVLDAGYGNLPE